MKKKVLFYIDSLNKGGLDKAVLDLINNLDFNKFDVTLIKRFPGGYYSNFIDKRICVKSNMPFECCVSEVYNHVVRVLCDRLPRKFVYRCFVKDKYDVEIACGDAFAATLIGGSTNKYSKKILWEHMDVTKDVSTATYFNKKQVERFFSPFDKIVGVSKECQSKFIEKYGFMEKTTYIYNPIDVEDILKKSTEYEVKEFDKDTVNIVAVGRLVEQKAFSRLIDVIKKLYDNDCKVILYIIGEGPEREALSQKIQKLDMEENIRLLGYKDNPYPYIKNADMLVCSSIHESYCLVVAESLILGTPVVSTRCTGPIELLDEGKYGLLVDNTEDGLYMGIKEMVNSREKREEFTKKALERKRFFDVTTCVKEWESLIGN